ncbi:hypothetical protein HDV01_005390 [Terramyces sp. JEL0728]|nr:hypothetical protein HDV01_005390 [Terramyces sp. JEL0728]
MHNAMSDLDMSVDSQERINESPEKNNVTNDPPSSLFDDCEDSIQETPKPNKFHNVLETPKASAFNDPFVDGIEFVIKSPFSKFPTLLLQKDEPEAELHPKDNSPVPGREEISFINDVNMPSMGFGSDSDGVSENDKLFQNKDNPNFDSGTNLNSMDSNDFCKLKDEMDKIIQVDEEFQPANSILNDLDKDSVFGDAIDIKDFTPQNVRTLSSIVMDVSPGSFFASRSGSLGQIGGGSTVESRPTWYTPKHDRHGKIIDPIAETPNDRIEKGGATPAGKRVVRKPLYESTPQNERTKPPIHPVKESLQDSFGQTFESTDIVKTVEIDPQSETSNQSTEQIVETSKPAVQNRFINDRLSNMQLGSGSELILTNDIISDEKAELLSKSDTMEIPNDSEDIDPFDWQKALEVTQESTNELVAEHEALSQVSNDGKQLDCDKSNSDTTEINFGVIIISNNYWSATIRHNFSLYSPRCNRQTLKLCLTNSTSKTITWEMAKLGQTHLILDNEVQMVEDESIKCDAGIGSILPYDSQEVMITFSPVSNGIYQSLYQIKANGQMINVHIKGYTKRDLQNGDLLENSQFGQFSLPKETVNTPKQAEKVNSGLNTGETTVKNAKIRHFSLHTPEKGTDNNRTLHNTPTRLEGANLPNPLYTETAKIEDIKSWKADHLEKKETTNEEAKSPLKQSIRTEDKGLASPADTSHPKTPGSKKAHLPNLKNDFMTPARGKTGHSYLQNIAGMTPNINILKTPSRNMALPLPTSVAKTSRAPNLTRNILDFGDMKIGQSKTLSLKISNPDKHNVHVRFIVTGAFAIPIREMILTSRSFIILPVMFTPHALGLSEERLIVRKNESVVRIELIGYAT